ncbi:lytic transglycosylase domain-containing protein [Dyella mobilis]|uniref:Transglycosylase SLT domain-containing protein n=1 Tax=Dyella mobilis TaxID=1849582 RepID=A0ABS2KE21_9GAMM|nr:transglycosylase SLT domain-containing protein [Dyella mobilis]MBM7129392.1 transglycosylase SLT domain-containing protein [Dyella mobilis]GLQ98343.1 hypothetical protein GCM10007863_27630 [Dyella mobilis]
MANKKILSIDIDDERFKVFYEQWKEFSVDLENMPDEWKELAQEAEKSHEAIAAAAGMLLENLSQASRHAKDLVDHLKNAADAQKDFVAASTDGEITLKKMGKEAKEFAGTIFNLGKFLMKLDVIGAVTSAGAFWGIDKLAGGAIESQKFARGLGMTTGQLKAFGTDVVSRGYSDASTLDTVSNAKNDFLGRSYLSMATGLTAQQVMDMDAGSIAIKLTQREHDLWNSTSPGQRPLLSQQPWFQGLGQGTAQFQRSGAASQDELTSALTNYQNDSRQLNINDNDTNALFDFKRQLVLAGQMLETDFSDKLAELNRSGALSGFIHALGDDAKILVDDVLKPENLNKIKDALSDTARFLGSEDFKKDLDAGASAIKEFANTTASVVDFLKKEFPAASDLQTARDIIEDPLGGSHKNPKDENGVDRALDFLHYSKQEYDHVVRNAAQLALGSIMKSGDVAEQHSVGAKIIGSLASSALDDGADFAGGPKNVIDRAKAEALFRRLEMAKGLPAGIMDALAYNESSYDASAVSKKGAQGLFQLMPEVSKALGMTDPFDWRQSALGAAELLEELQRRYKGDLAKELAAWNWNPSAVDKDVAQNGPDWLSHSPQETQNLYQKVVKTMRSNQTGTNVTVTIVNRAGADIAASVNSGGI